MGFGCIHGQSSAFCAVCIDAKLTRDQKIEIRAMVRATHPRLAPPRRPTVSDESSVSSQ